MACFEKTLGLKQDDTGARVGLEFGRSVLTGEAHEAGEDPLLPEGATPGEYARLLRLHLSVLHAAQEGGRPDTVDELLESVPDFGSFLGQEPIEDDAALVRFAFQEPLSASPEEQRAVFLDERVFATVEMPIHDINAEAALAPNWGWLLVVRRGLMVFIYKIARILCTRIAFQSETGEVDQSDHLLSWEQSCALLRELFRSFRLGYPACPDFPASENQLLLASKLALKAGQFVLAHEIGHLALSHVRPNSMRAWRLDERLDIHLATKNWEEELEADRAALNLILRLDGDYVDVECRHSVAGVELFLQICSLSEQELQSEGSATHSPFRERIRNLRDHLRAICLDDVSFEAVMQIPRTLEPLFERLRDEFGHS